MEGMTPTSIVYLLKYAKRAHGRLASASLAVEDVSASSTAAAEGPLPPKATVGPTAQRSGRDDPYELALRAGKPLSNTTFRQRTTVFETLLQFVNPEAKQPPGSLLDMLPEERL